jgi:hypothetical protein
VAENDESPWYRSLLAGIGAMLGVALLVGALISLVALGAVSITGIGDTDVTAESEPSLHIPPRTGGADRSDDGPGLTLSDLNGGKDPRESDSAGPGSEESRSPKPKEKKSKPPRSVISLSASPTEVAQMEQIYLSGTYPGGEGASLQVQRFEGSWTNFPSSTSVSGGTFTTYVMTGQSGPNKFRVVDSATGKKSNAVTVTVR